MSEHLVGVAEVARMLNVSRQRVDEIVRTYDDFPQPEVKLDAGRIWSRTAVEDWLAAHQDRPRGRPRRTP